MRLKLPTLPSAAFVAAVLGLPATALQSGPPAGYYDSVDTSSTGALRSTLHAVIDDHQRFPYTSGSTDTWDILEAADNDPANSGRVLTVYRNASYPKAGGGNDFYNREHLWPVSYGYPQDNASNYPFTDCHALRLADDAYNSARNNKPFRNCDPGCEAWPTDFNSGNGGTGGAYPSDSNWTSGFGQSGTWEVWNIRRGDVARAILYMDLRYEGGNHTFTGANEPDLVVTNDPALIASGATGQNESLAYMGALDVLLEWHAADPVDDAERLRNDVVFGFQGNRNPFVDHPEWVDLAFSTVEPTIDPWINEFHYDNNGGDLGEFVEVAGPAGLDLGGYRLVAYNGSTGGEYDSESLSGVLPDEGLCIGTLAFPFANLQNGAPDGIALVDPSDNLIEFLSYEGTILATDGPAFGVASVDVGVSESSNGPLGVSLQRVGSGQTGGAFTWTGPAAESPGQANAGQT
ncbi:MAG: endonuclease, partial [Planctomycetota bacterium]